MVVDTQCTTVLMSSEFSCDTGGKCLALASSSNDVLIVSGKPSEDFKVLGHTSKPNGISLIPNDVTWNRCWGTLIFSSIATNGG